jgi:hypothetical protein
VTALNGQDLAAKRISPSRIVDQARTDDELLQTLLQGISPAAKAKTLRENSSQALMLMGEQYPERLIPHWDDLVELLKCDNGFTKYVVIYVITALVKASPTCDFDHAFGAYFRLLDDESVMVASHVAGTAGQLARARPHLQSKITRKLIAIDKTHFDAGRRGLVASYAMSALDEYVADSPDRAKILAFVRQQLASPSPKARTQARALLKKWESAYSGGVSRS